ncbi:hypothetical protein BDV95DRAFT_266893 [Massariosphaeria phaeospora]|uniref:PNPLA domain-containing protein n=1 Tax=Massariosphaeria phaeospora TaxID=100035 RepID=A0A7C8MB61_9PLEO|nr:hypothetical protein BDV95DRAFT_266893 [Massariosphaeria phaeospora]
MPGSDLRLLALDGGGVRGLSALMILSLLASDFESLVRSPVSEKLRGFCLERASSSN